MFDLNGTIVNDHKIVWKVVSRIFKHFDIQSPTLQQFRYEFHLPYWKVFTNRGISEECAIHDCKKLYGTFYEEELDKVHLFKDAIRCLIDLKNNGYRLGLVSQSQRFILDCLVKRFGISSYFDGTVSLDDCVEQKPKPLPLLLCAERIGADPRECFYFGDMVEDQQAAYNARMFKGAVANRNSYHTIHALQNTKPHILVSCLGEIPKQLSIFENSLLVRTC